MSKLLPITAAIVLGLPAVASAADVVAVHCGHVFDAANAKLLGEHTVVIDGNRIRDVQPGNVTIDGAKAIDLGTQTCLPGLIDSHVHLTGQFSPTSYSEDRKSTRLNSSH